MPFVQRFQQGIYALLAFAREVDYELAKRYLNQEQMTLFQSMAKSEQLHSIEVLRDVLIQADKTENDLAIAALLHDSGKSRKHLMVWQKTISVLVRKFLPGLDKRLSEDNGKLSFWRAPFVVRRHHPKWSGELLSAIKSSDCVIWLVSHHADTSDDWREHPYYELLVRLQTADDAN